MGCENCANNKNGGTPAGCRNNGLCSVGGCNKLTVVNWLAGMELPQNQEKFDCVEVRFKNSRKEFFRNVEDLPLTEGDIIAVEASPGHDIGVITLTGELVKIQMNKKKIAFDSEEVKKIYRKARQTDIDKWQSARELEAKTMKRAREIAIELKLEMKISDVEFQGDKTKAIFYYTAESRVDFRELIKRYIREFQIRIEMRQIGMRQEAGRLGGIGSCGRELCCSTWLTDFRSVSTSAARYQQLSLNPLKLAGQCGKLKCCLNFELDSYVDELKKFPDTEIKLQTENGNAFFQKMDIFKNMMWYSYESEPHKFIELRLDRINEIIELNKSGKKPQDLKDFENETVVEKEVDYHKVVGQDSLTRFDKKNNNRKGKNHHNRNRNRNQPRNNNDKRNDK